jgi:hypothetical protein
LFREFPFWGVIPGILLVIPTWLTWDMAHCIRLSTMPSGGQWICYYCGHDTGQRRPCKVFTRTLIATLRLAAPEIVQVSGQDYISTVEDLKGGIQLFRLNWV